MGFPHCTVGQKDGTLWLCVWYHQLNTKSLADAHSMPRIDNLIYRLGKVMYISTFDLTRGDWLLPIAKLAMHLTAFITSPLRIRLFGPYNVTAAYGQGPARPGDYAARPLTLMIL